MNGEQLLDCMNVIDEAYILEADKPVRRRAKVWRRALAIAACTAIVMSGAWYGMRWYNRRVEMLDGGAVMFPSDSMATSETYQTLSDLLESLGKNEDHENVRGEETDPIAVTVSEETTFKKGQQAAVVGQYSYHLGADGLMISDLSTTPPTPVDRIDGVAPYLFYSTGGPLIVVDEVTSGEWRNETTDTLVTSYDVSDPKKPKQQHQWTQRGRLSHVYMAGDDLVLMTSDGACACGWSRLNDASDYKPQLTADGQEIAWTEKEMSILGEPSRVQYLAVTQIDTANALVKDKQAFYGNVDNVYYGADWLALSVYGERDRVYTFATEDGFVYTGTFGVPDDTGADVAVCSVTKQRAVYRVIGTYRTGRGGHTNVQILAMTVDMKRGDIRYALCGMEDAPYLMLETCEWEKDRAVITVDLSVSQNQNRFVLAEFSGMNAVLYTSDVALDPLGTTYPYEKENTLIALDDGIYVRMNNVNGYANGLDVYDLSDNERIACLHKSEGDLSNARFEPLSYVYDAQTFGILVHKPDENGNYRSYTPFEWRIYRVDLRQPEPCTLLSTQVLATEKGFATFAHNGQWYVTSRDDAVPLPIAW